MGGEWSLVRFADIVDINPTRKLNKRTSLKFVSMSDVKENQKHITFYGTKNFSGGSRFKNGDTIFARITPCLENGKTAYVDFLEPNELAFGSTEFIVLAPKEGKCDSEFVYYIARSPQIRDHAIKSMIGSSGRQRVANDFFDNLDVLIPPIQEQKAITGILSTLDSRIKTNHNINETLEEIARAIFKRWFIDFEFPNENGEPYKSSGGEMIDSPLGPIPKGWRVGNISDIANILGGGTPRTSIDEYWDGDIPFFTPKDAKALYCIHTEKCLTKKGLQSCSSRLYEKNTVFITARGTVGKLALAGTPMAMNQSCYALTGKEVSQYFLYFAIDNLVDSLKQSSHGAVFSTITTATLESTKALIPEARMERNFRDRIASFFEIMLTNDEENGKLSKLRDALLPKLMSGELRVTDIEDKLGRGSNAEST